MAFQFTPWAMYVWGIFGDDIGNHLVGFLPNYILIILYKQIKM